MRHRPLSILIFRFMVGLFAIGTAVKAVDDPNSGTWKMNPAKSKYDPGPAPTSSTTTIESNKNKYKVDGRTVNADGTETHISFAAKTDGMDYPISGAPNADMISVKRVDANTIETTWKKDGKTVMKTHALVSSDGKTRTVTFDGVDPQGHNVHSVVVFEKAM
jgi:ABC-type xylose transport system substrate-binding protein